MRLALLVVAVSSITLGQMALVQRNVNLRRDPSTTQPPLTLLMPPATLVLVETAAQAGYYHVQTETGQEGWVWAKNVTLSRAPALALAFIGPAEIYPDHARTPGFPNPDVTQENLANTICSRTFRTGTLRPPTSFTTPLKITQMVEYGNTTKDPDKSCVLRSNNPGCYEEDHLISLENGGHPRDPRNLWPEPYSTRIDGMVIGARQKDVVENYIRNAICFNVPGYVSHGKRANASLSLKRGQEILSGDWYACFSSINAGRDCR
jgi:hypothetical protein